MKTGLLITTFNRADLLGTSLARLARLTLPDEIVLVDDGGTDETPEIFRYFVESTGIKGHYIYHDNPEHSICSFARNVGLKRMEADIVITSEPELIFLSDVIADFTSMIDRSKFNVISAGIVYHQGRLAWLENIVEHGDSKRLDTVDYESTMPGWEMRYMCTRGWVAPYTAAYRRKWLMEIGGWDESFPGSWGWDDIDLITRLRINGHPQLIANHVEVLHQWHGAPPEQGASGKVNEAHFYGKSFHSTPAEEDMTDVVANRGVEWGRLKPRK